MVGLCFNTFNTSPMLGADPDLPALLDAVRDAGFPLVGLDAGTVAAFLAKGNTPDDAAGLLTSRGLRCFELLGVQLTDDADASVALARQAAELAGPLGAEYVLTMFDAEPTPRTTDTLGRCADAVVSAGARLSVEPLPFCPLRSLSAATTLCRDVGLDRARVLVDVWHFVNGPDDWPDLEALPLDVLGYVQFNDAPPVAGQDLATAAMQQRVVPGDGSFDLDRFCRTLREKGFDGVVSLEVLSAQLRAADQRRVTADCFTRSRGFWG